MGQVRAGVLEDIRGQDVAIGTDRMALTLTLIVTRDRLATALKPNLLCEQANFLLELDDLGGDGVMAR